MKQHLVEFRVRRSRDSELGRLYGYLEGDPRGKSKFEEAICAFWMPLAYYAASGDAGEAKNMALKAIALLEAQIQLLRRTFKLEESQNLPPPVPLEIFPDAEPDQKVTNANHLLAEDYLFDDE